MKYLKKFDSEKAYKSFTEMADYPLPNVCLVEDNVIINSSDTPFYVEAVEDLVIYPDKTWFLYSYDNENWEALTTSSSTSPVHTAGRKVFIKASGYSVSNLGMGTLRFSGRCKVGGNIRSMLSDYYHDDTVAFAMYQFYSLFRNATTLISAKDLKITGPLNSHALYGMFYGCTNLVEPPVILSKTAENSYQTFNEMFYNCQALKEAPVMRLVSPDITSKKTFNYMLYGCSSLAYIKTWLASYNLGTTGAFYDWVQGVASYGVFVVNSNANLNWTTSLMPAGWEKKLCDIDTGLTFISFKIDGTSYQADDEMTWEEWVASDYNTAGLTSDGTNIISDAGTLLLGGNAVLSTDFVKCIIGTDYAIGTVTETTTE